MHIASRHIWWVIVWTCIGWTACTPRQTAPTQTEKARIPVIFDTDANNELDDQHALAYLLLNDETFEVLGITVNATYNGGNIEGHYQEARRILQLCDQNSMPLYKGADGSFAAIKDSLGGPDFDGAAAVDFIIDAAHRPGTDKLVLLAVGKLTNVALAHAKDPSIASRVRLVWLGSNYPEPGEYNQDNDTVAMNYLLQTDMPFEMVTVRYGKPSGTDAVKLSRDEAQQRMAGLGPRIAVPVEGRHGGTFTSFGDYSANLFEHIDYYGDPPSRALFDMAAVAIVKDSRWAQTRRIPAPILTANQWVERPGNLRQITLWENFDRDAIMNDFFATLLAATPAQ